MPELERAYFAQETAKRQSEVLIVLKIVQTTKLYIGKGHNFIQVCKLGRYR